MNENVSITHVRYILGRLCFGSLLLNVFNVGVWANRKDTSLNQAFDSELVKEEKRLEVEETIRLEVDELMREELKNLKAAIDKSKDKKKKKKSKKKKKGKKKKKEKDLTPDKTITELFTELVEQNVIVKPENYHLSDFLGDYSYLGTTLRQAGVEPMPSLTDARHLAALYGILPLGSEGMWVRYMYFSY